MTEEYDLGTIEVDLDKEEFGRAQKASTKKKIAEAVTGKNNSQWKDGRRAYRDIAGAKKGEGVHHRDGDSKNNKPSNLEPYKLKGSERSEHEKEHKRNLNTKSSGGRRTPPRGYVAKRKA